jgi:hypothetical protein
MMQTCGRFLSNSKRASNSPIPSPFAEIDYRRPVSIVLSYLSGIAIYLDLATLRKYKTKIPLSLKTILALKAWPPYTAC